MDKQAKYTPKYNKTNSKYTPNSYGAFGVTVWCQLASLLDTKKGRRFGVNFGVREKRALHGFAVLVWCALWCRLVYKCTIFGVQHRFQTLALWRQIQRNPKYSRLEQSRARQTVSPLRQPSSVDFGWTSVEFGGLRLEFGGVRWISVEFGGLRWSSVELNSTSVELNSTSVELNSTELQPKSTEVQPKSNRSPPNSTEAHPKSD